MQTTIQSMPASSRASRRVRSSHPLLGAPAVAADVRVGAAARVAGNVVAAVGAEGAVLQADVVVVDRDDPDGSYREGIPVAGEGRLLAIAGEVEAGLVGEVALGAVGHLILVIALARHPRPVACRTHVVVEE